MIENISSNKTWLQLRFALKNKDLKSKVRKINENDNLEFAWAISAHAALLQGELIAYPSPLFLDQASCRDLIEHD